MFRHIVTALLVFIVYVLFVGSLSVYTALTGMIVAAILSTLFARYIITNEHKAMDIRRLFYMVYYFFKYMSIIEMRAHLDVVKRIFTMDIKPGIVRVPVRVSSRYARLLVMGSITNTPGTVVVDEKGGYFYVNWINTITDDPEVARKYISEEFEHYAYKIFE
ncbi:MAG: Na+/H+ antiporter subunit E [Desulfurococcaceae archaeon]